MPEIPLPTRRQRRPRPPIGADSQNPLQQAIRMLSVNLPNRTPQMGGMPSPMMGGGMGAPPPSPPMGGPMAQPMMGGLSLGGPGGEPDPRMLEALMRALYQRGGGGTGSAAMGGPGGPGLPPPGLAVR